MKKCSECKIEKLEGQFYKDITRKDGLQHVCSDCCKKRQKQRYARPEVKERRKRYYSTLEAREKQKQYRSSHEFKKRKNEYNKQYWSNPEFKEKQRKINRENRLKHYYGISIEQYNEALKDQEHKCRICRTDEVDCLKRNLVVDHCHKTGKVRGLLCNQCNLMLGFARDNPEILNQGSRYLKEFY